MNLNWYLKAFFKVSLFKGQKTPPIKCHRPDYSVSHYGIPVTIWKATWFVTVLKDSPLVATLLPSPKAPYLLLYSYLPDPYHRLTSPYRNNQEGCKRKRGPSELGRDHINLVQEVQAVFLQGPKQPR